MNEEIENDMHCEKRYQDYLQSSKEDKGMMSLVDVVNELGGGFKCTNVQD